MDGTMAATARTTLGFRPFRAATATTHGYFDDAGYYGSWWSSSPSGGDAWYRNLLRSYPDIYRYYGNPRDGFSVRCLRDAD